MSTIAKLETQVRDLHVHCGIAYWKLGLQSSARIDLLWEARVPDHLKSCLDDEEWAGQQEELARTSDAQDRMREHRIATLQPDRQKTRASGRGRAEPECGWCGLTPSEGHLKDCPQPED